MTRHCNQQAGSARAMQTVNTLVRIVNALSVGRSIRHGSPIPGLAEPLTSVFLQRRWMQAVTIVAEKPGYRYRGNFIPGFGSWTGTGYITNARRGDLCA